MSEIDTSKTERLARIALGIAERAIVEIRPIGKCYAAGYKVMLDAIDVLAEIEKVRKPYYSFEPLSREELVYVLSGELRGTYKVGARRIEVYHSGTPDIPSIVVATAHEFKHYLQELELGAEGFSREYSKELYSKGYSRNRLQVEARRYSIEMRDVIMERIRGRHEGNSLLIYTGHMLFAAMARKTKDMAEMVIDGRIELEEAEEKLEERLRRLVEKYRVECGRLLE